MKKLLHILKMLPIFSSSNRQWVVYFSKVLSDLLLSDQQVNNIKLNNEQKHYSNLQDKIEYYEVIFMPKYFW